eukprot:UN22095
MKKGTVEVWTFSKFYVFFKMFYNLLFYSPIFSRGKKKMKSTV